MSAALLRAAAHRLSSRGGLVVGRQFSTGAAAESGRLYICGTAESNKLGLGDSSDREVPEVVEALADVPVVQAACGRYHTLALTEAGDVYAWGLETSGQLGLGSKREKAPTPKLVEALSGIGVTALAAGQYHSLALTSDGDVYSCGFGGSFFNGAGGLGHGDRTTVETFQKISGFTATAISAGGYHSAAVDASGDAWTWGRGEWGRLGHNDSSDCYEPTLVETIDALRGQVTTCLTGEVHTGCLTKDGGVYTWGRNENWQLGYEVAGLLNAGQSLDAQQEPQLLDALPDKACKLSCGELGTAALLNDGSVYVWGMGRFFEPTLLPGTEIVDGAIVDVQVGAYHLALLSDTGRMYTFGTGPSLALPRSARKQWELCDVSANALEEGSKVLSVSCGPYTTAIIVAA